MENLDCEFELSQDDRELLARARRSRVESRAPEWVRQRVVARSLAAAREGRVSLSTSAAELVPVTQGGSRASLFAAALAALVVLPVYMRKMSAGDVQASVEPEPEQPAASRGAREAGEQLLRTPLFNAPAGVLGKREPPPYGPSLLGDRPFSELSEAWQVRRWNDLTRDPTDGAVFDFDEGALCVTLDAGERVLGGWPWAAEGVIEPDEVPLAAGRRYRLAFRAWAHEPMPAQLLFAVGHSRLPFSAAAGARVQVSDEPESYVIDFDVESSDPSIGVAFLASNGKDMEQTRVCVSDVTLHER